MGDGSVWRGLWQRRSASGRAIGGRALTKLSVGKSGRGNASRNWGGLEGDPRSAVVTYQDSVLGIYGASVAMKKIWRSFKGSYRLARKGYDLDDE